MNKRNNLVPILVIIAMLFLLIDDAEAGNGKEPEEGETWHVMLPNSKGLIADCLIKENRRTVLLECKYHKDDEPFTRRYYGSTLIFIEEARDDE